MCIENTIFGDFPVWGIEIKETPIAVVLNNAKRRVDGADNTGQTRTNETKPKFKRERILTLGM
jgi:hypothetical protein